MNISFVTKAVHSVQLAYAQAIGDDTIKPWDETSKEDQIRLLEETQFCITNPIGASEALHDMWVGRKLAEGWKYGKKLSEKKMTHPCMVPYEKLDQTQRADDAIRVAVIRALEGL